MCGMGKGYQIWLKSMGRCKICAVWMIPKKADKTTFMQNREMCQKCAE